MKPFTVIAIVVFVLVSLFHLLRYVLGWEIIINAVVIPMWVSMLGFVIAGGLAFLLWRELK
ncbi:MAG: hypothetical protein ACE5GZ_00755 [Gammaproteobacteria bacterium]